MLLPRIQAREIGVVSAERDRGLLELFPARICLSATVIVTVDAAQPCSATIRASAKRCMIQGIASLLSTTWV